MHRYPKKTPISYIPHSYIFARYYLKDGTILYRKQDERKFGWAKGFNSQWADKPVPLKFLNDYPYVSVKHPKYHDEKVLVLASHLAFTLIHRSKPLNGTRIRMKNGNKTDFRDENMDVTAIEFERYG